jgi:hypothetical protein
MSSLPGSTISAILRHDNKNTSYKIALLRAINDVVLAFPDLANGEQDVARPLRMLADRWIAYYWPFVGPQTSILQGPISQRDGQIRQDMSFRSELTRLYHAWEQFIDSSAQPSDGYLLIADLRVDRLRQQYPVQVIDAYTAARRHHHRAPDAHSLRWPTREGVGSLPAPCPGAQPGAAGHLRAWHPTGRSLSAG